MKAFSMKCVFLLLGTLCFIMFTVFYVKSRDLSRKQTADDSVKSPVEASCSLRRVVQDDEDFRRNFSFLVPVLQWSESSSGPTREPLMNREPPYGWRGLPADVLESALSLLNTSRLFDRDSPARCVRCAVVGNGGILNGSRQGRNIDSHDFVFRVNGAVTKGFEEDVGTKTSFYVFSTNTMKRALSWYRKDGFSKIPQSPEVKYIFIPADVRDYLMIAAAAQNQTVASGRDKGDRPWQYFGHKLPEDFRILHPGFISYVAHSFLASSFLTNFKKRHMYIPSSGALMLMTALHTCDQVSAYGFITSNYAEFSDHYYDRRWRRLVFYSIHDMRMESRLWESLHQHGIIQLYQRRGGGTDGGGLHLVQTSLI